MNRYKDESSEEIWDGLTNYATIPDFFSFGDKLDKDSLEKNIRSYLKELPSMTRGDLQLSEEEQETIYKAFREHIDNQLVDHCINCFSPLDYQGRTKTTCETCGWINEQEATPTTEIEPITIKTYSPYNIFNTTLIAYPPVDKQQLAYLPEGLQEALLHFFKQENYSKTDYDNIYHNLYKKDMKKFNKIVQKYKAKSLFAKFIQHSNFI